MLQASALIPIVVARLRGVVAKVFFHGQQNSSLFRTLGVPKVSKDTHNVEQDSRQTVGHAHCVLWQETKPCERGVKITKFGSLPVKKPTRVPYSVRLGWLLKQETKRTQQGTVERGTCSGPSRAYLKKTGGAPGEHF
ncbi:hypothetical protein DSO57_1011494 [Entomophthora muscae]|uniref:Uncharacterized protein n=1 Tax=Entomophthora muscae TaxID=34485 RepID=A0ACC2TTS1_9FUNG|nr:hypothetical protein DSO57_1011494 [Entomophthora muscae]